jgi:hypothetical protein
MRGLFRGYKQGILRATALMRCSPEWGERAKPAASSCGSQLNGAACHARLDWLHVSGSAQGQPLGAGGVLCEHVTIVWFTQPALYH